MVIALVGFCGSTDFADGSVPGKEFLEAMDGMIAELGEREGDDSFLEGEYPVDRQIELLREKVPTLLGEA